jgi:Tol biopolymer transport system component
LAPKIITRRAVRAVLLAVALVAGVNAWRAFNRSSSAKLPPAIRSLVSIPANRALDRFALSPDGNSLAYTAEADNGNVYLSVRTPYQPAELVVMAGGDNPFFSPDGKSVAYFASGAIWKSSIVNVGDNQRVCDAPGENAGGTWTGDGRIVFAPLGGRGLMAVASSGGEPVALTTLNSRGLELAHGWPQALPGGGVVFTVAERGHDPHLEVLSPSNARGRLFPAIGQAEYESTGHLVYSYLGDLYAVPFDAQEMKTRGVPVAVARGVQTSSGFDALGRSGFALSPSGTLAWVRTTPHDSESELVRVAFDGSVIARLKAGSATYQTPRLSPDGRRLAVVVRDGMMTHEIRVLDLLHDDRVALTLRGGDNQSPAWTPDGRLSFASNRDGVQKIYVVKVVKAAGQGASADVPKPLFSVDPSSPRNPSSWRRTPPLLAFYEIDPFRARDVLVYRVGEAILPVAATPANERSPVLSPDGGSIAYVSDASGRDELYVNRLEDGSEARQISQQGGIEPVWTGKGLFYRDRLDSLEVVVGQDTRNVFTGRRFERDPGGNAADYDVDPRGKFLVMLKGARRTHELELVKNWGTELAAQVPAR